MRILVTNDDGIHAEGIWALARALAPLGELVVVAPDREQSGVGTALSLGRHLRVTSVTSPLEGVAAWTVEGTPGDAVVIALHAILEAPPDALVSGINVGSNVGNDTLISGTVGAAMHGFFHGVFSVAVSLNTLREPRFALAGHLAAALVEGRRSGELPQDLFLNLNVPSLPAAEVNGLLVLPVGEHSYLDTIEEHLTRKGQRQYVISRGTPFEPVEEGTDVWGLRSNYAVLTPMRRALAGDARWRALEGFAERTWQRVLAAL